MILIKSTDPYLLARMGTEMCMIGLKHNLTFVSPFDYSDVKRYIRIYDDGSFQYLNHTGIGGNKHVIYLTDDNYNQVVMQLESLKETPLW